MKFIGQYIQGLIARFRNSVFFENVENADSDTDKFLVIGANGKLKYRTGTQVVSDIGAITDETGDITGVSITTDSGSGSRAQDSEGTADFSILGTDGVGVTNSGTTITVTSVPGEIDHDSLLNFNSNEHFTQANITTTGTITTGVWQGTTIAIANGGTGNTTGVQGGKNYRIINTSFRADIGTTKYYLPLKSRDEQTVLTREENQEVAVCDGRLVSLTWRAEAFNTHTGDATVTFGVETNTVGSSYSSSYSVQETESVTVNNADDQHLWHVVFDSAKHWDSTDMFTISMQSDTDITGSNERIFITLVIEDDWSTYLAGATREIDTTP